MYKTLYESEQPIIIDNDYNRIQEIKNNWKSIHQLNREQAANPWEKSEEDNNRRPSSIPIAWKHFCAAYGDKTLKHDRAKHFEVFKEPEIQQYKFRISESKELTIPIHTK